MSDAEETEEGVSLGEGPQVEGAPLARVTARLTWPIRKSDVERREGEAVVRTPDGPQTVSDLLEAVDETYFDTPRNFEHSIRAVTGAGPVPTADE